MGMRIPRDSRVDEVSATNDAPFDCKRKSVGKGRLSALACRRSCGGKKIPRAGDVGPAMWPLASVYTCIAHSGAVGSGSTMGRGWWCVSAMIAATR